MNNFQLEKNQKRHPMSEYLYKLQIIVSNTEFKDKEEADRYETLEMRSNGDRYVKAMQQKDPFESYTYDNVQLYNILIANGVSEDRVHFYIEHPEAIPNKIKSLLIEQKRSEFVKSYVEENPYYVMLSGKPFPGSNVFPPEKIVTIPDGFYNIYQNENVIERNMAVHEMPLKYQDLLMNTQYYQQLLVENPDQKYLKYIGSKAIPIEVSRAARDGDIMKINTSNLTSVHPVFGNVRVEHAVIHLFTRIYRETHRYVYGTLRGDFSEIYPNYNSFIRFLTIYMAIGGCLNELMKNSSSMIYMNQSTANDFFMLYGLPSVIMQGSSMMSFLKQFRMILMDKGTNVVYRVKDLIGYEYTDIYTLVMVKQQVFENGLPKFTTDEKGNHVPVQEIVFRRLGTTDDNTSYFKYRDSTETYSLEEITSGDPRWWNTPEVEQMLQDMNYTLSNSKYIQLSTHMTMEDIYWQCVILIRGLLDNRYETEYIKLATSLNTTGEIELSVFEAVLILEILMNWHIRTIRHNDPYLHGDMYIANGMYNGQSACIDMLFTGLDETGQPLQLTPGSPYKLSSFNFDLPSEDGAFYQSMWSMDYLEPEKLMPMLEKIYNRTENNIGDVLMGDVYKVYKYLEEKLRRTATIQEFRQTTDAFRHLFLVDPERNWYDEGMVDTTSYLCETYKISLYDLTSLTAYYDDTDKPDFVVTYHDKQYGIDLHQILSEDVMHISYPDEESDEYPFQYNGFVDAFMSALNAYANDKSTLDAISGSLLSVNVKLQFKDIIADKVVLDVGNGLNGPKTFEALLFRNDPDMYKYLISLRGNDETLIVMIRSLIKALEGYVNTSLQGLEFAAIGKEHHFSILKEVISYFKSYMVEFSKEEFIYIFDGLFDQGGNSNMLKLFDTIVSTRIRRIPKDSLTLHDAGQFIETHHKADTGLTAMYDEMIVHRRAAYKKIKQLGFDIIFDNGKYITKYPTDVLSDDDKLEYSIYENNGEKQIRIYLK